MKDIKENKDLYYKIAILSFIVYLFFDFFGTSLPFKPRAEEINEISSSNLVNQIVYSLLFFTSFLSVISKRSKVFAIITEEKLLTLFLIWCFASIIWSIDPVSTFKRIFRTLTLFMVTFSLLSHTSSTREILKYIKPVLYLYIFSTVAVCLIVPGAIDPQFHTWRGFTSHKNVLGQEAVICTLLSFFIFKYEEGRAKIIAAISVVFSLTALIASGSVTSITSFLAVCAFSSILVVDKIFKPIGLGKTVSTIIFVFIISMTVTIIIYGSDIVEIFTNFAGKDVTFSGRTDLWTVMLNEISKHPIIGFGYQAFWSIDNPSLVPIYDIFIWLPNQAHNGYLDILNDLGLIGFSIFILAIIRYFLSIKRLNESHPWVWLVIATLIINLQESTFFRPGHLVGEIVVISYFILFSQILRERSEAVSKNLSKKTT